MHGSIFLESVVDYPLCKWILRDLGVTSLVNITVFLKLDKVSFNCILEEDYAVWVHIFAPYESMEVLSLTLHEADGEVLGDVSAINIQTFTAAYIFSVILYLTALLIGAI